MKRSKKIQNLVLKKIAKIDFSREVIFKRIIYLNDFGDPLEHNDISFEDWKNEEVAQIEFMLEDGLLNERTQAPQMEFNEAVILISATKRGHDQFENSGLFRKYWNNIKSNVPTIVTSVIGAVLISWAVFYFGPPI